MLSTANLDQPIPETTYNNENKTSELFPDGIPDLKRHTRSLKLSLPDLPMITRRRLY